MRHVDRTILRADALARGEGHKVLLGVAGEKVFRRPLETLGQVAHSSRRPVETGQPNLALRADKRGADFRRVLRLGRRVHGKTHEIIRVVSHFLFAIH